MLARTVAPRAKVGAPQAPVPLIYRKQMIDAMTSDASARPRFWTSPSRVWMRLIFAAAHPWTAGPSIRPYWHVSGLPVESSPDGGADRKTHSFNPMDWHVKGEDDGEVGTPYIHIHNVSSVQLHATSPKKCTWWVNYTGVQPNHNQMI